MTKDEAIQVLREAATFVRDEIIEFLTGTGLSEGDNECLLILREALAATEKVEDGPIPIEYSTDPDGELSLDWMNGDTMISISIAGVGKLSWATSVGEHATSGSREFDIAPSVQGAAQEQEK